MSKYKYMSERRAWIWAANDARYWNTGLCGSISTLLFGGFISERMHDKMLGKLRAFSRKNPRDSYFWPLTVDGHHARAEFARRMSRNCTDGRLKS